MDNILVTVCARGGSKGLKNKNIKILNEYPLIYYTLKLINDWERADQYYVSTDSEEIAKVVRDCGYVIHELRPPNLANNTIGKIEVIRYSLKRAEELFSKKFDVVVDLDVTAPIRKVDDLNKCLTMFENNRPKTLFSVTRARKNPFFNMVKLSEDNRASLVVDTNKKVLSRQSAPDVFDMNASIYFYKRDYLMDINNKTAISDDSMVYIMDDLSAVDIDNEIDFYFIEYLYKNNIVEL